MGESAPAVSLGHTGTEKTAGSALQKEKGETDVCLAQLNMAGS